MAIRSIRNMAAMGKQDEDEENDDNDGAEKASSARAKTNRVSKFNIADIVWTRIITGDGMGGGDGVNSADAASATANAGERLDRMLKDLIDDGGGNRNRDDNNNVENGTGFADEDVSDETELDSQTRHAWEGLLWDRVLKGIEDAAATHHHHHHHHHSAFHKHKVLPQQQY